MSDSPVFEWACQQLHERTALSDAEARGTLRLVLKDAGLQPHLLNQKQLEVVLQRLLAPALARLKVPDAPALCEALRQDLESAKLRSALLSSPEDVFSRLARK